MPRGDIVDEDVWDDDEDDDEPTVPCPHCGHAVYEDSPRCPSCGNYISEEDIAPARKPWWIIFGVLLALLVALWWIVG
jgi:endogenous inhibitor of DNA gyrase (YacG/DUF329 family)